MQLFTGLLYVFCASVALLPSGLCQTGLSEEDRRTLLDAHNSFRGNVTPSASNMEEMVWNDELAGVAQAFAEQCMFEHNANRVSQQATFASVGENLVPTTSSTVDYQSLVEIWFSQSADYSFDSNSCAGVCGSYTQLVWATSRNVGCGAFRCANLLGFQPNSLFLVCNYGPAGNFVGQSPYMAGDACTACPDDLPGCVSNLCSANSPTMSPTTGLPTTTEPLTSEPLTITTLPTSMPSASTRRPVRPTRRPRPPCSTTRSLLSRLVCIRQYVLRKLHLNRLFFGRNG